jgi:hypothetical protein
MRTSKCKKKLQNNNAHLHYSIKVSETSRYPQDSPCLHKSHSLAHSKQVKSTDIHPKASIPFSITSNNSIPTSIITEKKIQSREIRRWKKLPRAKEICELKFEENKTKQKKHNKTKQSFKPKMFICTTIELTFTSSKSESSLKQSQGSETSRSYTRLSLPTQNTGSHNQSKRMKSSLQKGQRGKKKKKV